MYEKDKIFLAWIISSDLNLLLARLVRNNISLAGKEQPFKEGSVRVQGFHYADTLAKGKRGEKIYELVKK